MTHTLPDNAPHPLPDRWLDIAASQASTQWVKQFIQNYLPQLQQGAIQPDTIAALFDAELEQRKLITPSQQKNYRSNLTQALKVLDPNHPAIDLVALSTETYRELNDIQRGRLADRETKYFTSAAAQTLVDRATALLNSAEWSEVAAGLAVLIGRRISEVLLSRFEQRSDWSIEFSEMAKKDEGVGVTIEIPTLAPAAVVLNAIDRLQSALRIDDLRLESVTAKGAKRRVNSRYSEPVAGRCDQHFADLIPTRTDRENLYTHVFRGVYASIASHWFCPPIVPEHNFKAEIQGHFTLTSTGQKLPNYSARANYDDYAIGTPDGNRDGRLGIKLGQLPGLQVIEAFRQPQTPQEIQPMEIEATADASTKTIAPETQIEAEPDEPTETIPQSGGKANATEPPVTTLPTALAQETTAMSKPADKRRTKRPEIYADDLEDMMRLMLQLGTTGAAADVFHALLEAFQQQRSNQQQQQAESVTEMGKALNRFLDKIQSLESTVSELAEERDRLKAGQEQLGELQRLQVENDRLHAQVGQLQAELADPRKMLERVLSQQTTAPTEPIATPTPIASAEKPAHRPAKAANSDEPKSRNAEETKEKINHIIDAMISWNSSRDTSSQMLAISIPAIKGIGRAIGATYQAAIQEVVAERREELDELNQRWMLGARHNATVRGKDDVLRSIARENLGIENWQIVEFA